jgi:hypothetical protein
MGWLRPDSPQQRFWENIPSFGNQKASVACMHGMANLAVTETELKAIKTPVSIIIGDADPCRRMYVDALTVARPDWPLHVITNADHLSCVSAPEFKVKLKGVLLQPVNAP